MYDDNFLNNTLTKAFEDDEYFNVPKGITRYDYSHTHGWWVRVTRDGTPFRQMFSDGLHGSPVGSLKAAIQYRHEILSSFPMTVKIVNKRTLSSKPEERIKITESRGKINPYISWESKWYDENHKIIKRNFSVKKYGEQGARILALEATIKNHNKRPKLTKIPDNYQNFETTPISISDVEVLASINSKPYSSDSKKNIADNDPFAFEGERKLEIHKKIERDSKLRNQKISTFIDQNGSLFCELCEFNFIKTYDFLKVDIIEVHHIVPLATLSNKTKNKLSDLMLLCSNCHFAIHQGDAEENLLIAMEHFEKNNSDNKQ